MWDNLEGGRRRKPMGQSGQVPSKMGVTRWIPNRSGGRQATGRQV